MIAYSSNCLISVGWLASIAEGDCILNETLLTTLITHIYKEDAVVLFLLMLHDVTPHYVYENGIVTIIKTTNT